MAITYEWSFPNFETNSENVVKTIHWRYTATETVGEDTHTASMYGSCAGSDGMNFDSMTRSIVKLVFLKIKILQLKICKATCQHKSKNRKHLH